MKIHKNTADGFAVEPEIGEVFECNERRMKCIRLDGVKRICLKCCMSGMEGGCTGILCTDFERSDSKYVYFKEVQ